MIPPNIGRQHIVRALRQIEREGIPGTRGSRKFHLCWEGKHYPPKYVLSVANRFANGRELEPSQFSGGQESNGFLSRLGFKIVAPPPHPPDETKPEPPTHGAHDERCPECKKAVRRLLEEAYGAVCVSHKFDVPALPQLDGATWREALHGIFERLQQHRGHKRFVRTRLLPACDFFVPNPGFVVEFDESQHFTLPRKLTLEHYPRELRTGFSRGRWIGLCESTLARDNNPPFRDEQRAWYDTLRDFLPLLRGAEPTVRLHASEMQWCALRSESCVDVARFRAFIERRRTPPEAWLAVVLLQSNEDYTNRQRTETLERICDAVAEDTEGKGVVLFPGGWLSAGRRRACSIYGRAAADVGAILDRVGGELVACLGIDGRSAGEQVRDQIAVAIDRTGLRAAGRKFAAAPGEQGCVQLSEGLGAVEAGKRRFFELDGLRYCLCACYDSFGLRQQDLANPGVHVVLDCIHWFYPKGMGPSGDVYFAKHGLAGAAKAWNCMAFGAAAFFHRSIPERWPSGVIWSGGRKSTQKWRYTDNQLRPVHVRKHGIPEGGAVVRLYAL